MWHGKWLWREVISENLRKGMSERDAIVSLRYPCIFID
jgi:hypothetical protein